MKLLLIRPPFAVEKFYFPRFINESLAVETLDAYLSQWHEVEVIDAVAEGWNHYWEDENYPKIIFQGLKQKKLLEKIKQAKPDMVGLTWLFSTQDPSIDLVLKTIRQYSRDVPILVGGPHPSANLEKILKAKPTIDIIVYGEGELTTREILDKKGRDLKNILGIAYRDGDQIKINDKRPLIENLDTIPFPKRNKRFYNNYSKQKLYQAIYLHLKKIKLSFKWKNLISRAFSSIPYADKIYFYLYNSRHDNNLPTADIITSRGCPNHCRFCAVHNITGHLCRMRSAHNVLAEIEMLVNDFGVRHINFQDDNFNVLKNRTIDIAKGIVAKNYDLTILAPAGAFVPTLDEEVLTWLKKAGLNALRMSIESGNQEILTKVIKKNINLSQVKGIVDICKKLKIHTEGAFIFGIPGETISTMQDSINFAKYCGFDREIRFIFQPFPNTELYDECVAKGYLTDDYDPAKAYITGNHCFVKTEEFTPEDVKRMVARQ